MVNDHIMIPHLIIKEPHEMVSIDGRIKYPGRYPIKPGITTVADIIKKLGAFFPIQIQQSFTSTTKQFLLHLIENLRGFYLKKK